MNSVISSGRPLGLLALLFVVLCCGCSEGTDDPTTDGVAQSDTRLVGKWKLVSQMTLENGHNVTLESDYEFKSDGTFTNDARTKLLNGDTDEPFYIQRTAESGTWTVEEDQTCWTTVSATLEEFESFTELITREAIEEGLSEETPPECFQIVSADSDTVVIRPLSGGGDMALTKRD